MCLLPPLDTGEMSSVLQKPPVPECENMNRIAEVMDVLRAAPLSVRRTTTEYVMLCLVGFSSIEKRDALMRVLQWTLEPLLLYSAFIKEAPSNEFEALIVTKKQVVVDDVEQWLDLFNMGICLIQFDGYMQPDMVTCISRIHHTGKHWYGTFKSKSAARVRRDFYAQYGKDQRAKDVARVLTVTGLAMTPNNMLHLHSRVNELQNRVSSLERDLQAARSGHGGASMAHEAGFAALAHANLASAYRRIQARGDMPEIVNPYRLQARANLPTIVIPPVMLPENIPPVGMQPAMDEDPPPPPPDSPIYIRSPSPERAHPVPYIRRPPPTGDVVVFVVRDP